MNGVGTDFVNPPPALVADSVPIPPRFWWLKRILIASGGLFVGLVALRLWWGWYADRQLQAEIDRIIAAGEPIYPEDFDPKEAIPDDQNAAFYFRQAGKKLSLTAQQSEFLDKIRWEGLLTDKRRTLLKTIIDGNNEVLNLTEQARQCSKVNWEFRLRSPVINAFVPDYSDQRALAKYLAAAAVYQRSQGDYKESFKTISQLVTQGDDIRRQPTLIPTLVGIAAVALATYQVEFLAPSFVLESTADGVMAPDRQQVVDLIVVLLDQETVNTFGQTILSERMYAYDIYRTTIQAGSTAASPVSPPGLFSSGWFGQILSWPIDPIYTTDFLWILQCEGNLVEAAKTENHLEARRHFPASASYSDRIGEMVHPWTKITFPSLERCVLLYFRHVAFRRMAAVALALRLYQLDLGDRPRSLSELVPAYLSEIPDDPFAKVGTKIQYLPDANPPALYCINLDGVDNGGRYELRTDGYINMDKLDLPFFLNGDRPRPKSNEQEQSEQTGDNQGDIKNQEGKTDDGEAQEQQP